MLIASIIRCFSYSEDGFSTFNILCKNKKDGSVAFRLEGIKSKMSVSSGTVNFACHFLPLCFWCPALPPLCVLSGIVYLLIRIYNVFCKTGRQDVFEDAGRALTYYYIFYVDTVDIQHIWMNTYQSWLSLFFTKVLLAWNSCASTLHRLLGFWDAHFDKNYTK